MNVHAPIHSAMQVWFTAQELADAAKNRLFVGLPTDKRNVDRMAERDNWRGYSALARKRPGREGGGGYEYHIELLPLHERVSYLARFVAIDTADVRPSLTGNGNLTERARITRDAKLAVVRVADRFRQMNGLTQAGSDALFVQVYNSASIALPDWVREIVDNLSVRSLCRWRAAEQNSGGEALGHDPALARKGSGLLDTANDGKVKAFILAWVAANPALSAERIRGYVEDEFGGDITDRHGELRSVPPVRTFQHFLKGLKQAEKVVLTKITNPDKYRSTMKLVGTGAYSYIREPNQLWQIDASPVDALCVDGRHHIYACIDIATRRLVITLSKTPRASAVALMIRKTMLKWGPARAIKTDNGSDFVAHEIDRLFSALAIEKDVSDAYSPDQKGHVERVIRTFQHEVCPQLPGYIGHSVAERKAIEERKSFAQRLGEGDRETFNVSLTAEQLQSYIDDWLEHVYHQRGHAGLKGMTPAEAAARSQAPIVRVDERALDVLLMPVAGKDGARRMTAQGIKIDGHHYLTGSILAGTDVFVRLDPIDMGKIYAFAAGDGRFLSTAICPELADIDRPAFVKAQKQQYADMVSVREREIRADVRKILKGPSGIERTIRLAKKKTAEREAAAANIIALPKREENHSTPQIAAALDAMVAKTTPPTARLSAATLDLHAAIERELSAPAGSANVTPLRSEPTPAQRFRECQEIEELLALGQTVEPDRLIWLGSYRESAEYKTQKGLWEVFGDQAPGLRT